MVESRSFGSAEKEGGFMTVDNFSGGEKLFGVLFRRGGGEDRRMGGG